MEPEDSPDLELLQLDDVEVLDNIDKVLPAVLGCLRNPKDEVLILRAISIALGPCLNSSTTIIYEEMLFKYACREARNLFVKTLQEIENFENNQNFTQTNYREIFSDLLNICLEVISYLQKAFMHVLNQESIDFKKIQSLPKCAAELLVCTYSHCKNSEEIYGIYYNSVNEVLTSLFKTSKELQQMLLQMLSEKGEVNPELAYELEFLDEVMTYLYKAALNVMTLEVKAMADIWRGYINVAGKYSEHLKMQHNISEPINFLSNQIIRDVEGILSKENRDMKEVVKIVKVSFFMLKVVIKLCELFTSYLGDCHKSLLKLLIFLSKYSAPYLESVNTPKEIVNEIAKQLTIGVEPLVSQLMDDSAMCQMFSLEVENFARSADHVFGYLMVCCTLMKKLMHSKTETRNIWYNSEDNVVDWLFSAVSACNHELHLDMNIPSSQVPGKPKLSTGLYEFILVNSCAFVVTSTSNEFNHLEKILLSNVLQTDPWCALLAIDIWCVIARFADSDLVFSQLQMINNLLNDFPNESSHPEKAYLASLGQRLFPLMSQKHKTLFLESLPPASSIFLWNTFGTNNSSTVVNDSVDNPVIKSAMEVVQEIQSDKNTQLSVYEQMESALSTITQMIHQESGNKSFLQSITNLWKFEITKISSNNFFKRYLPALCRATALIVHLLLPIDLFMIVQQMRRIVNFAPTPLSCLCMCSVLSSIAKITIPQGTETKAIIDAIPHVFYDLLISPNLLVKQTSLEVFAQFAYMTSHTEIIAMSLKNNPDLQLKMANYLQKKRSTDSPVLMSITKERVHYKHICQVDNEPDIVEPILKKPRLELEKSDEVVKIIKRLTEETNSLTPYATFLSPEQKAQLESLCNVLSSFTRKS